MALAIALPTPDNSPVRTASTAAIMGGTGVDMTTTTLAGTKNDIIVSETDLSIAQNTHFEADTISTALHVLDTERDALDNLSLLYRRHEPSRRSMADAVHTIAQLPARHGRLVVTGVGKSSKIAAKCVATMNSLGIRSAFLHPTEALHGDLGMISSNDVILIITFSGRTPELLSLLPHLPLEAPRIIISSHTDPASCPLITNDPASAMNGLLQPKWSLLPAPIPISETQSFGLAAPTTSTTVALALTDALALAVARVLHSDPGAVFQRFHPGGAIGGAK